MRQKYCNFNSKLATLPIERFKNTYSMKIKIQYFY